jgi:oligopeptidase B
MGAGHGGASGRFDRLDEVALAYAFALWAVTHNRTPAA